MKLVRRRLFSLVSVAVVAAVLPLISETRASAQSPNVVFSGRVVDLGGEPRVDVNVAVAILFQNDGREINAFDRADPRFASGKVPYNVRTAEFFLPIREDLIPAGDVSVRLRFSINGQVISVVDRLSALSSLALDVVVPDPVPTQHCCRKRCRLLSRR